MIQETQCKFGFVLFDVLGFLCVGQTHTGSGHIPAAPSKLRLEPAPPRWSRAHPPGAGDRKQEAGLTNSELKPG